MSKLVINDMEMPQCCDECNFHVYHSFGEYVCVATPLLYPMNLANYKGGRKSFCPLVALPPHDLVDREELLAEYDRQHVGPPGGARKIMEQATAIIKAEPEEVTE